MLQRWSIHAFQREREREASKFFEIIDFWRIKSEFSSEQLPRENFFSSGGTTERTLQYEDEPDPSIRGSLIITSLILRAQYYELASTLFSKQSVPTRFSILHFEALRNERERVPLVTIFINSACIQPGLRLNWP